MITLKLTFTQEIVRGEIFDNELWFHAGDVCRILGFKNPAQTIDPIEAANKRKFEHDFQNGMAPWFIDEEAFYTIALRCQGAMEPGTVAYNFRKEVIQILKDVRKTGEYKGTKTTVDAFASLGIQVDWAAKLSENDAALMAEPADGNIAKLVQNRKALKALYDLELKSTPTKEAVDREQSIENHILERLGRFPEGADIPKLMDTTFLKNRQMRSKKAILPVLQKLRSQGRCEEIALNTWKLTGASS